MILPRFIGWMRSSRNSLGTLFSFPLSAMLMNLAIGTLLTLVWKALQTVRTATKIWVIRDILSTLCVMSVSRWWRSKTSQLCSQYYNFQFLILIYWSLITIPNAIYIRLEALKTKTQVRVVCVCTVCCVCLLCHQANKLKNCCLQSAMLVWSMEFTVSDNTTVALSQFILLWAGDCCRFCKPVTEYNL